MDSLKLQVVLLCIAVCFGPSQSQGRHAFQPEIQKVSMTKYFHRLLLEWGVQSDSREYMADSEIVFNIQVNQENRTVLDTNYTVSLSELKHPLGWSWDPLVPLQCEPHAVRIRSLVRTVSSPHPETWSNWSPWEAVAGLDTLDDNKNYIFPMGSVVKAGSNFSFCCVAKETEIVLGFNDGINHFTRKNQTKELFHLKDMHARHVACLTSDDDNPPTLYHVIELPRKPKDFSCEPEDMRTLRCSWKTDEKGRYSPGGVCDTEFILSDANYTKTYCKKTLKAEHSCSLPIGEKHIPKLRLTARNCFGESHTEYDFYENHKVPSRQLDIWRDIRPGLNQRNITIFWKLWSDFQANGKIQAYEIRWEKVNDPTVFGNYFCSPKFNSTTIYLDYDSYKISVSAKNIVNSSPPSVMIISRTAGNETVQETKDGKIKNTSEGISVSWQPQNRFDGYVIDWCNYPKSHLCDFQWEKFGGNHSSAVIKSDAFRFNVTYTFRVYGSQNNTADLLLKKALYLEEPVLNPDGQDPNKSNPSVGSLGSYKHNSNFLFGTLLFLVIVPIVLIICMCFWKSSCIRKRCFPTIPQPDISPFLKLDPGTMKICDVDLDILEVMENHQISKGRHSGLEMLIIENITYFDPTYSLNLQEQETESNKLNPTSTSYKPLQDFFANKLSHH